MNQTSIVTTFMMDYKQNESPNPPPIIRQSWTGPSMDTITPSPSSIASSHVVFHHRQPDDSYLFLAWRFLEDVEPKGNSGKAVSVLMF